MTTTYNDQELLAIVNDQDEIIGRDTRVNIHQKGLPHRETALLIINSNNEILVQQRTDNLKWDSSVGGHLAYNDDYSEAIIREAKEELGINIKKSEIEEIAKIKIQSGSHNNNHRFVKFFKLKKDYAIDKIKFNRNEIKSIEFMDSKKLKEIMNNHPKKMTHGFFTILEKYLKKINSLYF